MFWLDVEVSFNQSTYRLYEGTVCITLVLNNPAHFDITLDIYISNNATGKLCMYACTCMYVDVCI